MIVPNATELQAKKAAIHIAASRQRQAEFTAAKFGVLPKDSSVVLATDLQRVFRMRKGILTASRLINARLADYRNAKGRQVHWVPVMVTLTYADNVAWQSEHISAYINCVQKWGMRQGYKFPYAWVMELTKKGKPHYHCIIWIPRRLQLPKADKRGWWPCGMTNTVRATNPYGYLSKYASKAHVVEEVIIDPATGKEIIKKHTFPKGARIHGIGGITGREAAIIAWWKLPKVLRLGDEGSHKWRRRLGGGWHCISGEAQGEIYESEWGLCGINAHDKRVRLVPKEKTAQRTTIMYDDVVGMYEDNRATINAHYWSEFDRQRSINLAAESVDWWGMGPRFPASLSSLELSSPVNQLGKFHSVPLPF